MDKEEQLPMDDIAQWHLQQEKKAKEIASTLATRDDLTEEVRERRMKRWDEMADWHAGRAEVWKGDPIETSKDKMDPP